MTRIDRTLHSGVHETHRERGHRVGGTGNHRHHRSGNAGGEIERELRRLALTHRVHGSDVHLHQTILQRMQHHGGLCDGEQRRIDSHFIAGDRLARNCRLPGQLHGVRSDLQVLDGLCVHGLRDSGRNVGLTHQQRLRESRGTHFGGGLDTDLNGTGSHTETTRRFVRSNGERNAVDRAHRRRLHIHQNDLLIVHLSEERVAQQRVREGQRSDHFHLHCVFLHSKKHGHSRRFGNGRRIDDGGVLRGGEVVDHVVMHCDRDHRGEFRIHLVDHGGKTHRFGGGATHADIIERELLIQRQHGHGVVAGAGQRGRRLQRGIQGSIEGQESHTRLQIGEFNVLHRHGRHGRRANAASHRHTLHQIARQIASHVVQTQRIARRSRQTELTPRNLHTRRVFFVHGQLGTKDLHHRGVLRVH